MQNVKITCNIGCRCICGALYWEHENKTTAAYRWLRGSNMPSVDNLYALSRYLNVQMDDASIAG